MGMPCGNCGEDVSVTKEECPFCGVWFRLKASKQIVKVVGILDHGRQVEIALNREIITLPVEELVANAERMD